MVQLFRADIVINVWKSTIKLRTLFICSFHRLFQIEKVIEKWVRRFIFCLVYADSKVHFKLSHLFYSAPRSASMVSFIWVNVEYMKGECLKLYKVKVYTHCVRLTRMDIRMNVWTNQKIKQIIRITRAKKFSQTNTKYFPFCYFQHSTAFSNVQRLCYVAII